jgi:NTE family protein
MYYRNSLNDRNYATRGAESIVEPMFQFGNKFSLNLNEGVDTLFLDTEIGTLPIPAELIPTLVNSITPGPYMTFYFKYIKYFPLSRKFQVVPTLATGLTVSGESENKIFSNFSAGGHQRIRFNDTRVWGLNYREFNAANIGKIGAELQYVALPTVYFRTGFNLASFSDHVPLEQWGTAFFDQLGDNALFGYGADITLKTLLGPITGGISTNTVDKNVRFYLSVGYSFNFADR